MSEIKTPPVPVLIQDLGMMFPHEASKQKRRYGLYLCSCGKEFKTLTSNINNSNIKSCGCHRIAVTKNRSLTHGMTNHRLYHTWCNMIDRTSNESNLRFKDYGDRGITVCDRWKEVTNFIEDMYPSYKEGLTLDRIDNNKGYSLDNCRWTTGDVQSSNSRKLRSTNKSGYRGVSFANKWGKWVANITVDYKQVFIGHFNTAIEAAKAYDKYVIDNNLEHTINFNITIYEERQFTTCEER